MKNDFGFGNVNYVPGVGYVQDNGGGQVGALGDDASVMMISGVGADVAQNYSGSAVAPRPGASDLFATAKQPYRFFGITLPLWVWLLVAAGAVGAGYVFFKKYIK